MSHILEQYLEYINEGEKQERARILKRPLSFIAVPAIQSIGIGSTLKYGKNSTTFKIIGGLALAVNLISLSDMTYELYLSKGAKACSGNKFKMACIMEYKAKATEAQIAVLTKSKSKCKKTDNPKACERKIDKKINELNRKIRIYNQNSKYYRSSGHFFK